MTHKTDLTEQEHLTFTLSVFASVRLDQHENDAGPRRACELAARWYPELNQSIETPRGADAQSILRRLAEGNDVPIGEIDLGVLWLDAATRYYETATPPIDGYRKPWEEAAGDMRTAGHWLRAMRKALLVIPATITVKDEEGPA
jgi:hypothetical protein